MNQPTQKQIDKLKELDDEFLRVFIIYRDNQNEENLLICNYSGKCFRRYEMKIYE